jgi:predicted RNase H-like nuclease (RuvC/YqgF family)
MSIMNDFQVERLLVDPKLRPPRHRSWSEAAEEWADWNLSARWVHVLRSESNTSKECRKLREENVNLRISLDSCEKTVYEMEDEIERLNREKETQADEEAVEPNP